MRFESLTNTRALALLTPFLGLLSRGTASPIADYKTTAPITPTPFYSLPNSNQAENFIVRSNGQLLVTVNTQPEVYGVDPTTKQGALVHHFPGYTSCFGIVELQTDVFYVTTGNFTGAPDFFGFQGTFSLFQLDLRGVSDVTTNTNAIKVTKVLDIPQAQEPDGLTVINASLGLIMTGDAQTGTLYLIDVNKKTVTNVLQDAQLAGTSTKQADGLAHIGINGMKYRAPYLLFDNTAKGTFGKLAINPFNGQPATPIQILDNYGAAVDDFTFDKSGNEFIAEPFNGVLFRNYNESPSNNQTRLISPLAGVTATAFGRGANDKCILYATFDGVPSGLASINVGTQGFCSS